MSFKLRSGLFAALLAIISVCCSPSLAQLRLVPELFPPGDKICHPFFPSHVYLTGMNAASPAVGDFNGDGILDIAALTLRYDNVYGWVGSITILVGEKHGTFQQAGSVELGQAPFGNLAVADFNRDGKLDIAVADEGVGVDILLGNGDGTFHAPQQVAIATKGYFVAVGDLNHDGVLDLAVLSYGFPSVLVLLGNADGTFQAPASFPVDQFPTSIAVADLNLDGRLDLAVSSWGEGEDGHFVSVLLGKGDGTFRSQKDYSVGYAPFRVVAADLNGDGIADLATANFVDGTASVLLNKGDGTFAPTRSYVTGHPRAPYGIFAGPLEPGLPPALVVATTAGTYVLKNNGDGTFQPAQGYESPAVGVTVADLNDDGKADLLLSGSGHDGRDITLLFGRGRYAFASSTSYVEVPNLFEIAQGDFNRDGAPDLVVEDYANQLIAISLGDGKGHFFPPFHSYPMPGSPSRIAVGDLNGDGDLDLAVVIGAPDEVQFLTGNGDGSFNLAGTLNTTGGYIALADLNGDRVLDVIVAGSDHTDIFLGKGDGTFGPSSDVSVPGESGLAVADFNRDGNVDVAVASYSQNRISVLLGKGNGQFKNARVYAVKSPWDIVAADFNGDGKLGLAVLRYGKWDVKTFLGNGDGTFRGGPHTHSFGGAWTIAAADFDGDGKADLIVEPQASLVYLLLGKGAGKFRAGVASNIGANSYSSVPVDLNGDGALDLVVPNLDGGEVSVLVNRCVP